MWTMSIVDGDSKMLQYINDLIGEESGSVFSAVYAALVIDYDSFVVISLLS